MCAYLLPSGSTLRINLSRVGVGIVITVTVKVSSLRVASLNTGFNRPGYPFMGHGNVIYGISICGGTE